MQVGEINLPFPIFSLLPHQKWFEVSILSEALDSGEVPSQQIASAHFNITAWDTHRHMEDPQVGRGELRKLPLSRIVQVENKVRSWMQRLYCQAVSNLSLGSAASQPGQQKWKPGSWNIVFISLLALMKWENQPIYLLSSTTTLNLK